jgi:hypothetical protein
MARWSATGVAVVLAGCTAGVGGGDAKPREGLWSYDVVSTPVDECGLGAAYDPGEGFQLSHDGDTLVVNENGQDFTCAWSGSRITCPEQYREEIELFGATAEVLIRIEATALSARRLEGTHFGTLNCTNPACDALTAVAGLSNGCAIEVDFEATWVL